MLLDFLASSVVDQYRQQALALGLSEQQQQQIQNSQQQQINALANDQTKLLVGFGFLIKKEMKEDFFRIVSISF